MDKHFLMENMFSKKRLCYQIGAEFATALVECPLLIYSKKKKEITQQ